MKLFAATAVTALCLSALSAIAQTAPAAATPAAKPAVTAKDAKAAPAPAAAVAAPKPDAAKPSAKPGEVSADVVKSMRQDYDMWQLDVLDVQTKQTTFIQTDPIAKKAAAIMDNAMASSPDIKAANEKQAADRTALMEREKKLRTDLGLDDSWYWNYIDGKMYQKQPAAAPAK